MSALLVADNLTCVRGDRQLFEDLSFTLAPGDALWVTGPNGAGKSSLLRLVADLLPLTSGQITRPESIALADERAALDGELTLAAALGFWAPLDGADPAAVAAAMTAMALTTLADVPMAMLSTGQRKRAVLARTIASGAQLWLLDEPGNGLDDAALAMLRDAVAGHRASGGAVLFASHFDLVLPEQRLLPIGGSQRGGAQ